MTWALWLAVPVAATLLAALWTWVRARPPRTPDTAASMRAHTAYLDALGASARPRPAPPGPGPEAPEPDRPAEAG